MVCRGNEETLVIRSNFYVGRDGKIGNFYLPADNANADADGI